LHVAARPSSTSPHGLRMLPFLTKRILRLPFVSTPEWMGTLLLHPLGTPALFLVSTVVQQSP
jgi:hypothetical protein